ncbi:hypothetical protein A8B82_15205 [Sulfitobacter sp. EhC04]|uniref:hypothetical protein n=1 Tax=Sulfitobacter sp. EhC04 TaxID=1849168 RepID=UPI0007F3FD95|nr:hypothetical protein [Sulfitobacter sp. EhC04]OAN76740.1 hypothetical protein A8B82_15205 [Sulfitobacter sp. EhC04]
MTHPKTEVYCDSGDGTALTAHHSWNAVHACVDSHLLVLSSASAEAFGLALLQLAQKAKAQPNAERTNDDRVAEFSLQLDLFHALTGVDHAPYADGPETAVSDLLAHAMHYCAAHGLDFQACVDRGTGHFTTEAAEERGCHV